MQSHSSLRTQPAPITNGSLFLNSLEKHLLFIFTVILNTLIHCRKKSAFLFLNILVRRIINGGHAVVQLFEALRYKPEGRGLDFRWCHRTSSMT